MLDIKYRNVINNYTMDALTKVHRLADLLEDDHGRGAASVFEGSGRDYILFGNEPSLLSSYPELTELWEQIKPLLDKGRQEHLDRIESSEPPVRRGTYNSPTRESAECRAADLSIDHLFDPNSYVIRSDAPDGGRRYVSDVIDMRELVGGKLNLIYAPTGCGKTTFVETALKRYAKCFSQELLYLVPTRSLSEAAKHRGRKHTKRYESGAVVEWWDQDGMRVMTYASFGNAIQRERQDGTYQSERWWNDDALICLDELSQAVHQAYYGDGTNATMYALRELVERCKIKSNIVVTLSATPRPAVDYFRFWNQVELNIVKSTLGLTGFETRQTKEYFDLTNLLLSLDKNQRGLIYIGKIDQITQAVSLLEGRGIHAVGIWSTKNANHPLNEGQQEAIRMLVSDERLPDDVQALIINTAYETGLNIRPERSHLDYIVVHNSNEDTITQVRGRYRGDLDTLYRRVNHDDSEGFTRPVSDSLIAPFLGMRLGKNEKRRLMETLNFRDDRGRLIGWTKVARHIRDNGYLVLDKKSGGTRYWMILSRADQ